MLASVNSYVPEGLGPIGVAIIFGGDELMEWGGPLRISSAIVWQPSSLPDGNTSSTTGVPKSSARPADAELDLKEGEVAFAEAVQQD